MSDSPAFLAAVAAFGKLQNPPKTSKVNAGAKSYWFAPLPEILDAVRPILAAHCLFVRYQTGPHESGGVLVVCEIVHGSGTIVSQAALVCPGGTNMQIVGSGLTYARRYTLTAALGIAADDDDDGEATARPPAPKQARPEPAQPLPPEFLEWLRSNRLTSLQFDVWRKSEGKPGVFDVDPQQLARITGWLDGKTDLMAKIRGGA